MGLSSMFEHKDKAFDVYIINYSCLYPKQPRSHKRINNFPMRALKKNF